MSESSFSKKFRNLAGWKIRNGLWLFLVGSVLQVCDTQLPIGLDFVEKEPLHVFNIDTVTVNFSTVYLDSIATSNTGRLLLGYHKDSILGAIEAKSYILLGNDSIATPVEKYSSYQEATFRLYYDSHWYYDTTQTVTFSLYFLEELLEANDDTDALYNTSSFSYDTASGFLGKISFMPKPSREYAEFPVDQAFGDSLFHAMVNEEDFITCKLILGRVKSHSLLLAPCPFLLPSSNHPTHILQKLFLYLSYPLLNAFIC